MKYLLSGYQKKSRLIALLIIGIMCVNTVLTSLGIDNVKAVDTTQDVVWTECDKPGWWFDPDSGNGLSYDTHNEGKDCVTHAVENKQSILVGYRNMDNPIDITEMDYIEFDLYVSETDIFSAAGDAKLELTSFDWVDNKEINYSMKDVSLNAGWNHVKLALADFGTEGTEVCNKAAITFMRLYAAGHEIARNMTLKVDNVKFTKEGNTDLVWTDCDNPGWWFNPDSGTELSYDTHNEGKDCVTNTVENAQSILVGYRNMDNPIDISEMDYMEFDLYVSEADVFSAAGDAKLELTSYDWVDNKEINYSMKDVSLNVGWNHVKLTLADFGTEGVDACSKEAITFMRLYAAAHESARTMTIKLDNVKFTNEESQSDETSTEKLVWTDCNKQGWWFDPESGTGLSYGTHNEGKDCIIHTVENKQSILMGYRNMDNPIDISEMDYIEFDLYVLEADIFSSAGDAKLELTSYDWVDNKEIYYSMKGVGLNAGWNHVKLALADFGTEGTEVCNKEAITFMRLYAVGHETSRNMAVKVDNVKFTKEGNTDLVWTDCDNPGWWFNPDNGTELSYDTHNEGKDCVTNTIENAQSILVGYRNMDNPIDISEMDYMEFDLYVSEADIFSAAGDAKLELTSFDWVDNKEINYSMKDVSLNAGWNHVKLTLADFGTEGADACNKEAITFMRLYAAAHESARTMTIKLDNVTFTKEVSDTPDTPDVPDTPDNPDTPSSPDANTVIWTDCNTLSGWFNPGNGLELYQGIHYEENDCVAHSVSGTGMEMAYRNMTNPIDISNMDYMEFDLYVSDADIFSAAGDAQLELTSYDWVDNQEINYYLKNLKLNAGWNHIKLALEDFTATGSEACDKEAITFMRIYTVGHTSHTMTMMLDDIKFTKDPNAGEKEEEVRDTTPGYITGCDSRVGWSANSGTSVKTDKTDKQQGNASITFSGTNMGNLEMIYRFDEMDLSGAQYLEFDLYVSDITLIQSLKNSYDMQVELSSSGEPDKEEVNWDANFIRSMNLITGWNHVRLPMVWATSSGGNVDLTKADYFRIYAVFAEKSDFTFKIDGLKVDKGSSESTSPLSIDCDTVGGWKSGGAEVSLDTTNVKQGTGSVKFTANNEKNVTVFANFQPVDISSANAIQFYLWVSDVTLLESASDIQLEITSSGEPDKQEIHWNKEQLLDCVYEDGWNLVTLAFDDAESTGGNINYKAMNYIRLYIVHEDAMDLVLNLDDIKILKITNFNTYKRPKNITLLPENNELYLSKGDSLRGWSTTEKSKLSLDRQNKVDGKGSIKLDAVEMVLFQYVFDPFNLEFANCLEFDLHVDSLKHFNAEDYQVELSSNSDADDAEINWTKEVFMEMDLKQGWNHIVLFFDDATESKALGNTFDSSSVSYFRFYMVGVEFAEMRIDNLKATYREVEKEDSQPTIPDMEIEVSKRDKQVQETDKDVLQTVLLGSGIGLIVVVAFIAVMVLRVKNKKNNGLQQGGQ